MKEFLEEMLGNPFGINKFLNLKYLSSNDDEHYFSVTFDESSMNPRGFVQGGMITAALDDATSAAMISGYEEKKAPMTTDLHVLFHRPLPIGPATMKVKIIKLGRSSATSEGRIYNTEDKLVATLLHTAQPVDRPN